MTQWCIENIKGPNMPGLLFSILEETNGIMVLYFSIGI